MGMYSELEINKKFLPEDLQECEADWQTKSYSTLDTLVINEDGKLLLIDWEDGKIKETNYTGEIRFYDGIDKIWWEFVAFFENGQMFKIVQIAPKVEKEIL